MVADEARRSATTPRRSLAGAKADQVREHATSALGEIGDPAATLSVLAPGATLPATSARPPRSPSRRSTRPTARRWSARRSTSSRARRRRRTTGAAPPLLLGDTRRGRPGPRAGRPAHRRQPAPRPPRFRLRRPHQDLRGAGQPRRRKTKSAVRGAARRRMSRRVRARGGGPQRRLQRRTLRDVRPRAREGRQRRQGQDVQGVRPEARAPRDAAIQKWKGVLASQEPEGRSVKSKIENRRSEESPDARGFFTYNRPHEIRDLPARQPASGPA